jgi:poly(A) polymerase
LGGLPDLVARRLRFVGDAHQRIREDYLRILRFFRFHAHYGDPGEGMDAEALAASAELAEGVDGLSRERIGSEIRKLLAAPDPAPAVAAMAQAGVLARVLPGSNTRALAPLVHLEGDLPPRWQRRLAALGGHDVEERLRLSRADAAVLAALHGAVGRGWSPAALGWKLGAEGGRDAVLLRAALLESPLPTDWQTDVARGASSVMPVTAIDLMPDLQGAALGARLKEIEARWLASDLRLTRSDFLD